MDEEESTDIFCRLILFCLWDVFLIKSERIFFFQILFSCSSENLRCYAVGFDPYFFGSSSHLHPTDKTNRIPLIVVLSLHQGLLRVLAGFGKYFMIVFHWESEISL